MSQQPPNPTHQTSPRAWATFIKLNRVSQGNYRNLVGDYQHLAKWHARFRLAKSFQGLNLSNSYAQGTAQIYSSFTRVFFTYTAFEVYCSALGLNASRESQIDSLLDTREQQKIISRIRQIDPRNKLIDYLLCYIRPGLRQQLEDFKNGQEVNVTCLAKSIRHIFAHGKIAAHSPGLSSDKINTICTLTSDFLLETMDNDFEKRVNEAVISLTNSTP
ncbi:hypothetical protein [Thermosynechococcus sp. FA-CM-4201]